MSDRWILPNEETAIDGMELVVSHIDDRPHLVKIIPGEIRLEEGTTWFVSVKRDQVDGDV